MEFRASLLEEILHLERENCNLAAPLVHTHLELAHLKYLSALIKKPNFIYTYTRCSLQLNAVKSVAFYIHINSQLLTFRVQPTGPKHKFRHFSTSVDIVAAGDSTAKWDRQWVSSSHVTCWKETGCDPHNHLTMERWLQHPHLECEGVGRLTSGRPAGQHNYLQSVAKCGKIVF